MLRSEDDEHAAVQLAFQPVATGFALSGGGWRRFTSAPSCRFGRSGDGVTRYERNEERRRSVEAVGELAWREDFDAAELLGVDCVQVGIAGDDRVGVAGGRERD